MSNIVKTSRSKNSSYRVMFKPTELQRDILKTAYIYYLEYDDPIWSDAFHKQYIPAIRDLLNMGAIIGTMNIGTIARFDGCEAAIQITLKGLYMEHVYVERYGWGTNDIP